VFPWQRYTNNNDDDDDDDDESPPSDTILSQINPVHIFTTFRYVLTGLFKHKSKN
jgi:hypothetical protein